MRSTSNEATRSCDASGATIAHYDLSAWVQLLANRLGPALARVSLFGSRARGTHRERSDIDLLVVLDPCDRAQRDVVQNAALEWELEHNLDLSLRVLSQPEYKRLSRGPEPFWQNLARDARQLWPTISTNE